MPSRAIAGARRHRATERCVVYVAGSQVDEDRLGELASARPRALRANCGRYRDVTPCTLRGSFDRSRSGRRSLPYLSEQGRARQRHPGPPLRGRASRAWTCPRVPAEAATRAARAAVRSTQNARETKAATHPADHSHHDKTPSARSHRRCLAQRSPHQLRAAGRRPGPCSTPACSRRRRPASSSRTHAGPARRSTISGAIREDARPLRGAAHASNWSGNVLSWRRRALRFHRYALAGWTSRRPSKRWMSVPIASSACMRASGAPRQKCGPNPKAT